MKSGKMAIYFTACRNSSLPQQIENVEEYYYILNIMEYEKYQEI